jgi:hypothetical protein
METQKYFTMQRIKSSKKLIILYPKRNQNPSRDIIITLIINLKFQQTSQNTIFQKSSYTKKKKKKKDLLLGT